MPVRKKTRLMLLALAAALVTLGLKAWAYFLTGSVAILSDAAESLINLTAALIALIAVEIASKPADSEHMYGHDKAEYFSSGVEGTLIILAAIGISYEAFGRLLHPQELGQIPLGLVASLIAGAINYAVAKALLSTAKTHHSMSLEGHAKHLLTDVWTTGGVVVSVGATYLTGFYWIDPLVAFLVAVHIVISGVDLLKRSMKGLMDHALPPDEIERIEFILKKHTDGNSTFHQLRTRQAGVKRFIDFHLLVPGERNVQETHDLCERIEKEIEAALPGDVNITTHIEPVEDPASWEARSKRVG